MDHLALWFASGACALLEKIGAVHWNLSLCQSGRAIDFGYGLMLIFSYRGLAALGCVLKFIFEG